MDKMDMSVSPMIMQKIVSPTIMNKYRATYDPEKNMEKMEMSVSPMILKKNLDML
jgi:hypothetical protein